MVMVKNARQNLSRKATLNSLEMKYLDRWLPPEREKQKT